MPTVAYVLLLGTLDGLAIALIAIAFALVYRATGVFFAAIAALYVFAPTLGASLLAAGVGWVPAAMLAVGATGFIAMGMETLGHARLERYQADGRAHLLCSLGLSMVLTQATVLAWGNSPKPLPVFANGSLVFSDMVFSLGKVRAGLTSAAVVAGFLAWLRWSGMGLRLRGLADNPRQMMLFGYDVERLRLITFGAAGVLVGMGALLAAQNAAVDPQAGFAPVLPAVVAALIGGTRIASAVPAAVVVGILEVATEWYVGTHWGPGSYQ